MRSAAITTFGRLDVSTSRWSDDRIFTDALAYDLAFAWDVTHELDVVLGLAKIDRGPKARLLLPACGTGRYALDLARRGFIVEASDINENMLALARSRPHVNVTYATADMTKPFAGAERVSAAFTFTNSFRYILRESDVAGHLRAVRAKLAAGATYVVDLGFTNPNAPPGEGAHWTVRYDDMTVRASWTLLETAPPLSTERARIVIERPNGVVREVVSDQPQRTWSYPELELAAAGAGFRVRGAYLRDGTRAPDPAIGGRYYAVLDRLEEC